MLKILSCLRIVPAAALLAGFAAPACARDAANDPAMRLLSVEQVIAVKAVAGKAASLEIETSFDHDNMIYANGERVRLFVTSSEDAFVTVLNVGPSGEVTQLFPNSYQPGNQVKAHVKVEMGANGAHIAVGPPFGAELIQIIAANRPLKAIPDDKLDKRGAFSVVRGGVRSTARLLEIIGDTPVASAHTAVQDAAVQEAAAPQDHAIVEDHSVIINRAIRTVP